MSTPRALLLTGGSIHDFSGMPELIQQSLRGRFDVAVTERTADIANLRSGDYKLLIIHTDARKDEMTGELVDVLEQFVQGGGGLLGIHGAAASFAASERFHQLLGSQFIGHGPKLDFEVRFTDPSHPCARSCDAFRVTDELYLLKTFGAFDTFAVAHWQGKDQPMGYSKSVGSGRVVYLANGHDARSLGNRNFQRLLQRAARVAAGEAFDTTIKAGILGYGGAFNMGLRHATAINNQPGMSTVAVCDLDPRRTEQAKVELPGVCTYNEVDAFMSDSDVDLAVVILPHNLHATACIAASKAGRHVVTEKPFCITLDEADSMIAAARDAGTMLSCFHNRRWDGDFLAMLDIIRAGTIGSVYRMDAATAEYGEPKTWWRSSKAIAGGFMYDWGAHYCDWLLNFANKRVKSVVGDFQKRKWHSSTNEDWTYALIRFEDDTTATLEQGSLAAIRRQGWRILGTEGGIENERQGKELHVVTMHDGRKFDTMVPPKASRWEAYYQNVANHLIMGEQLVVTAEQARRTIAVIAMAEESAKRGGVPVEIPGEADFTPDYMIPW